MKTISILLSNNTNLGRQSAWPKHLGVLSGTGGTQSWIRNICSSEINPLTTSACFLASRYLSTKSFGCVHCHFNKQPLSTWVILRVGNFKGALALWNLNDISKEQYKEHLLKDGASKFQTSDLTKCGWRAAWKSLVACVLFCNWDMYARMCVCFCVYIFIFFIQEKTWIISDVFS